MRGYDAIAERVIDLIILGNDAEHSFARGRSIGNIDWSLLGNNPSTLIIVRPGAFNRVEQGVARRIAQRADIIMDIFQLESTNMSETERKLLMASGHITSILDQTPTLALPTYTPEQALLLITAELPVRATNSFIAGGTQTERWSGENNNRFTRQLTLNVTTVYQAFVDLE